MAIGQSIRAQSFRRIQLGDQVANRMQDGVQLVSGFLESVPYLDGSLVEGVTLSALATTNVEHQLGRPYRGWLALKIEARPAAVCQVSLETDQTPSTGAFVPLEYDTVRKDTDTVYDASSFTFTLPRDGVYEIGFHTRFAPDGTTNVRIAQQIDWVGTLTTAPVDDRMIDVETPDTRAEGLNGTLVTEAYASSQFVMDVFVDQAADVISTERHTRAWVFELGEPAPVLDSTSTADASLFLPLRTGRECTVDLWVF